jgi:multidrug efflux pump subunit AcrA (membrane-fusion protein)
MKQLIAITLVLAVFFGCKKKEESTKPTQEKITESVYASGIIKSKNQYQVFSAVNGIVKEIFVTEGDIVKKGDPLYQLSNVAATLNAENAQINADYNSVASNVDKLNEAKIEIANAKAKMDNDASLVEKQRNLWSLGIGTKNELDMRELAYTNSSNMYNASKLRYKQIEKQLQLQEKQTQKLLAITQSNKTDFTVRSEFEGKVYSLIKKKGEMVNTQNPIALVGDANGFYLELQVDEYDIARVKKGQTILLSMDSYKNQVFEAVLDKINPAMNTQSKSFTIDANFVKPPPALYPNLTTEANIVIKVKEKALTIPRNYLLNNEYVLLANKEKRKVVIGLMDYEKVEIISGLQSTDVILKPAQ